MDVLNSSEKSPDSRAHRLRELAALFLRLGTTAFGGPAAHLAMFEDEVVRRRQWITHTEFLDMMAATNFIPGPNSTEMAIHIGYRRAGVAGLIVAGTLFIVPAALMVSVIAWAYMKWGALPVSASILYGVKPVVIAIIVQALWRLGKSAVKNWQLGVLALATAVAVWLGVDGLLALFAAGAIMALVKAIGGRGKGTVTMALTLPAPATTAAATGATTAAGVAAFGLWPMFLVFLKLGSVLFGSGYVLLAFLRADFVDRYHWLTEAQLLDATAVGQITPGPLFTTATFIGYLLGGPWGALLATVGIFLPAFFFVALSSPLLPHLRKSTLAGAFLDGLNVASLALMAVVTVQLGKAAVIDFATIALALISGALLFWKRINSTWLVLAGAIAGILWRAFIN